MFWSNETTSTIQENNQQHITGKFKHTDLTQVFMISFIYALQNSQQHITSELKCTDVTQVFIISFVYSKCKVHMRSGLWETLVHYSNRDIPWCTIVNFNVITSMEEIFFGNSLQMNKSFDCISVIESCGFTIFLYTGILSLGVIKFKHRLECGKSLIGPWSMINGLILRLKLLQNTSLLLALDTTLS